MKLLWILVLILAGCSKAPAEPPALPREALLGLEQLEEARQWARTEDRPLLLLFTCPYCLNCRLFETEVLTQPRLAERLQGIARLSLVTGLRGQHAQARTYQVELTGFVYTPAMAALDPVTGKVLGTFRNGDFKGDKALRFIRKHWPAPPRWL